MRRYLILLLILGCDEGGGLAPLVDLGFSQSDGAATPDGDRPPPDAGPDAQPGDAALDPDGAPLDGAPDGPPPDAGPDAAPPDGATPDAAPPVEGCGVVVRFQAPLGTRAVQVAGDFTGWADGPLALDDADGDGVFERVLSADDGLRPGEVHPYKLIVDGQWQIDPGARYRKYDGDCVNGGLELPACDQPWIEAEPVAVDWREGQGDVEVAFTVRRAADGAAVDTVSATLDGVEVAVDERPGGYGVQRQNLAPGKHRLVLSATDAEGRRDETVLPFWVEAERFDYRDSTLYLLFLDWFANGDRGNDDPVGAPVEAAADWRGGDLQGALEVLRSGYFERLGARTIWLSPVNAQVEGHFAERGGGERRIAPYHGYWPVRAREVDPRFGGNEALRAFVDEAHRRGIRVLLDLINNQVHEQHEYVNEANASWFRTDCVCGIDPGCGWSERPLECLFARYLPDINWRDPGAEAQFTADALYWIEEFDVDGFRVDAVKHVETTSIYNLRAAIGDRFERGGHRVVMLGETAVGEGDSFDDGCGEIYPSGYAWIAAYIGENGLDGQFDFPTHHRISWGLLTGNGSFRDIDAAIAQMEREYGREALNVGFLGSHDSNRMQTRAALDPAQDCRWPGSGPCAQMPAVVDDPAVYQRLRRAWTLLMTMPVIPLLYYGDDIALPGGGDPDNRRPMPWTGDLAGVAIEGGEVSAPQLALREHLEALADARRAHPALTRGRRTELYVDDDFYVYARQTNGDAAIVVLNRGGDVDARRVELGPVVGRDFEILIGAGRAEVSADAVTLTVPAGGDLVLGERR